VEDCLDILFYLTCIDDILTASPLEDWKTTWMLSDYMDENSPSRRRVSLSSHTEAVGVVENWPLWRLLATSGTNTPSDATQEWWWWWWCFVVCVICCVLYATARCCISAGRRLVSTSRSELWMDCLCLVEVSALLVNIQVLSCLFIAHVLHDIVLGQRCWFCAKHQFTIVML